MIGRLTSIITTVREFLYRHAATRYLCYLAIVLALLCYHIFSEQPEIAFVYNAF